MMIKNLIQSTLRAVAYKTNYRIVFLKFRCLFEHFPENTANAIETAKSTAVVNIIRNMEKDEAKKHWRLVQAFSVLSAGHWDSAQMHLSKLVSCLQVKLVLALVLSRIGNSSKLH